MAYIPKTECGKFAYGVRFMNKWCINGTMHLISYIDYSRKCKKCGQELPHFTIDHQRGNDHALVKPSKGNK